jgi:transmembrane sensor
MNSTFSQDPAADEQAALWAARLEGSKLSAADREALDVWLEQSPDHRARLSRYCQFSADLEVPLSALVHAGAIARPPVPSHARSRWSFPKLAGLAAGMAAAAVLAFWITRSDHPVESFTSPAGQRQTLRLADGTTVELNARTNLQFVNRGGERRARLVEGEAFFVVSKDKTRPFTVETPAGTVRVTGTTFDVRADSAALDVTVVEGAVQVVPSVAGGASGPSMVDLGAGDGLSATARGVIARKLSAEAMENLLAWRQGKVVFVDEPLEAALARFARYHGRSIQVSPAAGKLLVGGIYRLEDLDGFLLQNEEALSIRTVREPGGSLRVGLRSE